MANQSGRPVASARKLIAAVLGTIAVFVMVFGLGMASWAIVALGGAMLALAVVLSMANVMRRGERTWVVGQGLVKAISEMPLSSAYGRAEIQLTVVAPGLSTADVLIRDPRVPVAKWPRPGDTVPISVDLLDIRRVRIDWSQAADQGESGDPPPPEQYEPAEEYLDDDLLGTPEPPPWTTRDRVWGRGPDEPPAAGQSDDLILKSPIVVRDTPGGPVLEGQFEAHDDVPRVLPQRARPADPVTTPAPSPSSMSSAAPPSSAGSPSSTRTAGTRPSPRPRRTATSTAGAAAAAATATEAPPTTGVPEQRASTSPWSSAPTAPEPPPTETSTEAAATHAAPAASTAEAAPATSTAEAARATTTAEAAPTTEAASKAPTDAAPAAPITEDENAPRSVPVAGDVPTGGGAPLAEDREAAREDDDLEPYPVVDYDQDDDTRAADSPTEEPADTDPAERVHEARSAPDFDHDIDLPLDGDPEPAPEFQPAAKAAMASGLIAPPADAAPRTFVVGPDPEATPAEPATAETEPTPATAETEPTPATAEAEPTPADAEQADPEQADAEAQAEPAPAPLAADPAPLAADPSSHAADPASRAGAETVPTAVAAAPDDADQPTATGTASVPAGPESDTGPWPERPIITGLDEPFTPGDPTPSAQPGPQDPQPTQADPEAAQAVAGQTGAEGTQLDAAQTGAQTAQPDTAEPDTAQDEPRDDRPASRATGPVAATLAGAGFGIALGAAANDADSNRVKEGAPSPRGPWADLEGGYEPDERADDLITAYPSARPGPAGAIHGIGITILVTDMDRSISFYRDTLGFFEIDSGHGSAVLASGDTRLVLRSVHALAGDLGHPIHLNLEVGDVEAVYEELRHKNVRFEHAPRAVNRGDKLELWAATFHDPDGHSIAITQWRATR